MMLKRLLAPRFSLLDVFFIGLAVLSASDGNWLGFIAWLAFAVPASILEELFGEADAKPASDVQEKRDGERWTSRFSFKRAPRGRGFGGRFRTKTLARSLR